MVSDALIFLTFICAGLLFYGCATYAVFFNPRLAKIFVKLHKVSWVPFTMKEEADGVLKIIFVIMFLVFSFLSIFIFLGWLFL